MLILQGRHKHISRNRRSRFPSQRLGGSQNRDELPVAQFHGHQHRLPPFTGDQPIEADIKILCDQFQVATMHFAGTSFGAGPGGDRDV